MPKRKRASKARVQVPSLGQSLSLRGGNRAELVVRFGSEEMALAMWRAYRTMMLQTGYEEPALPPYWNHPLTIVERRRQRDEEEEPEPHELSGYLPDQAEDGED
jgi:hypothetical protein